MGRFAIWMGSYTHLIFLCPSPASHQGGMRNGEQMLRRDHAVLVSSVGFCLLVCYFRCVGYACAYGVRRQTLKLFAFSSFFSTAKKRKQKMPLSCAEGGSAQRKALCGSHTMRWPARWVARGRWGARRPCALCAMVLSEGLLGWHFCHGFSECLGNVKGIITKPSHKESKRLKQRSEHPRERNASKLASHKSRATLFVRDS